MDKEKFIKMIGMLVLPYYFTNKVLPSLTIAQAILESGWGTSTLAVNNNNFFGLNNYNDSVTRNYGKVNLSVPQERDGKLIYQVETMCSFESPAQSVECMEKWYDRDKPAYKALHGCLDYKRACALIREAGYATDSQYTAKLIRIIEENHLTKWDEMALKGEDGYLHVQVNSFQVKANAIQEAKRAAAAGFPVCIKLFDGHHRVQFGAYVEENNATAMLEKARKAGWKKAYITRESGTDVAF